MNKSRTKHQDIIKFEHVNVLESFEFFALRRAAILSGCVSYYPEQALKVWTDPATDQQFMQPIPDHFYFAKIGEQIAASGLLNLATGRIDAMFVSPTFFRHGIGRLMIQHLEQVARQHGLVTLQLDATLNAVDFYRAQGFSGETLSLFESPRGVSLKCMAMSRILG